MTTINWWYRIAVALLWLTLAGGAAAQKYRTEEPSDLDRRYMNAQRQQIDDLLRLELGERLRGDERDLELLQTLLDRQLVKPDDRARLQALGIILGDRLQRDLRLKWIIYIDQLGRTRALAIPGTNEFLFPVTMIAQRAEAGANVDVRALYDHAAGIVDEVRSRSAPF